MDAPLAASSGHQGTAMALAPLGHVLFSRIMRFDPADPAWPDRDRFVLSNGHASILQYSLLFLCGFGLELDDLEGLPPVGVAHAGPPRAPPHPGHRGDDRAARPGARRLRGHGHRRARAAGPVRRRRPGPPHLRHRRRRLPPGGHQPRGGLAGRAPRARPPGRRLRRQPHHHRRRHRALVVGRRRRPASAPTAGTSWSSARSPTTATRSRPPSGEAMAVEDRPSFLAPAQPHRLPVARPHGRSRGPRAGLRRRRRPPHQGRHGHPGRAVLGAAPTRRRLPRPRRGRGGPRRDRPGRSASPTGPATGTRGTRRWAGTGEPGWQDRPADVRGGRRSSPPARRSRRRSAASYDSVPGLVAGAADLTGNTGVKLDGAERQSPEHPDGRQLYFGIREHAMGASLVGMACHGGVAPRRRHVLRLQRLPQAQPAAGRHERRARRLRLQPRLGRRRRGRPHPPAHRAAGRAAGHPRPPGHPAGRRQRDRRGVAGGGRPRRSHRPDPQPPGRSRS